MVRLVDVPLDAGDASRAVTDIEEAIAQSRSTQAPSHSNTRTTAEDPRFVGKSTEEIVAMYKNLESHSGRLANRLGQVENQYAGVQQQVNQLILGKSENDLRKGSGSVEIQPADLMVNPTEAIDRYLQSRQNPEVSALQRRLQELEQQLSQTTFSINHPKAEDVTQDPAFAAWVRQTPLRMRLAQSAAQNNLADADLLLQEWKHTQDAGESQPSNTRNRAQELARSVTLESSNTSSESGTGQQGKGKKMFRSSDLIALRQRDPDKYESPELQNEIVKAYLEGRVIRDQ